MAARERLMSEFRRMKTDDTDPQQRGIEFQDMVAGLFRLENFVIEPGARVARPRQTDLLAKSERSTYLIETKWQRRVADVSDVDALRSRLSRTEANVIGLLISVS